MDTETEHKHFNNRVKGGGVWIGCGKRLLDSGMRVAARAVSLAASSGLRIVIFSLKITSQTLVFFFKSQKKVLRRIGSQTSSLLQVWESLFYAVLVLMEGHTYQNKSKGLNSNNLNHHSLMILLDPKDLCTQDILFTE